MKELEERILQFWDDQDIFRKSVKQREGSKPFVFFEGPPTANGSPGIHHFIGRVFKDVVNRYQTMRGRYVVRKGGWDTHGLPVELQVEKELGFKSKKDIEAYGIAAFNRKCRESVWKYKSEWDRFTRRSGYWVDLQDPYVTYENSYMESLWHIIGEMWSKKLLYQAHRVVPFCTRCGTPLSSHEVSQGYKTVTDTSVYIKFKVTKSKLKLPKNTFILAWTTTPWTLPGNVALAVGRDIPYVLARKGEEHYIIAAELANKVLGAPLAIEAEFTGAQVAGTSYEPLFAVRALKKPNSYRVYEADFVTISDGTGVVHTAVMYGVDDYELGDTLKLVKHHTVTERGTFVGVSPELDGAYVKSVATEALILKHLEDHGLLLSTLPYEHEYPFCWRCDTPLLYYAKDSWFVRMSSLNKDLLANNETVNWVPDTLKHGRFGQWIKEAKDWAFSRERYWGTPLPIWLARDSKGMPTGQPLIVSSLEDLDTYRADTPAMLWVMRHGESEKNVAGIIDVGDGESHLTETGQQQALISAQTFKKMLGSRRKKLAAIVTSPVLRARETADIVARELGVKNVIVDERLWEIKLGPSLAGKPVSVYDTLFPTYEDAFQQRPADGESLSDLRERMWGAVRALNDEYAGKEVLIVSHEYPVWMLTDAANGWSMEESISEKKRRGEDFITFAEIQQVTMRNLPRNEHGMVDLHRPYIDQIVLKKGSKKLYRIPEICDVWFDSGAMPYAQWHVPFEHADIFKQQFPADFIAEAIDQTRGWFYTLLAVSTVLGKGAPYRNVLCYSHVLDEKGQKMSKSKGNIVKPDDVIAEVGADTARWYFYTLNAPGDPKNFSMKEVRERLTGFIGTLQNCLRFYELYQAEHPEKSTKEDSLLDQWMYSRLHTLTAFATERFDAYDLTATTRAIEHFVIDDFSQWWLRRSRKRADALSVLRETLRHIALLIAPCVPFVADDLWQRVRNEQDPVSVHLADWPVADRARIQPALEEQMDHVRSYITEGLAARKNAAIKVRQPLASVQVPGKQLPDDLEALIREELNVKAVRYAPGEPVMLDTAISETLRAEGWAREVMRAIQDMRKEAGCRVTDQVACAWHSTHAGIAAALETHRAMIMMDTGLNEFIQQQQGGAYAIERTFDLAPGASLWIALKK